MSGPSLELAQYDALAGSLRRIETLAVLLGAPAGGRGDSSMECALVAEAADMIAEEARRMREQLGIFSPRKQSARRLLPNA